MKKKSTLIYLIKNYQKDVAPNCKSVKDSLSSFAKAENGQMAPSEQTINNIFGFARSYEVVRTRNNGSVEMILN